MLMISSCHQLAIKKEKYEESQISLLQPVDDGLLTGGEEDSLVPEEPGEDVEDVEEELVKAEEELLLILSVRMKTLRRE